MALVLQEVVFQCHSHNRPSHRSKVSRWWRWGHSIVGSWECSQAGQYLCTRVHVCKCVCKHVCLCMNCPLGFFQVVWQPTTCSLLFPLFPWHTCTCVRTHIHTQTILQTIDVRTHSSHWEVTRKELAGTRNSIPEVNVDDRSWQQRIRKSGSSTHTALLSRTRGKDNHRQMRQWLFFFHLKEISNVTSLSKVLVTGVWRIEVNEQSKHWYL